MCLNPLLIGASIPTRSSWARRRVLDLASQSPSNRGIHSNKVKRVEADALRAFGLNPLLIGASIPTVPNSRSTAFEAQKRLNPLLIGASIPTQFTFLPSQTAATEVSIPF